MGEWLKEKTMTGTKSIKVTPMLWPEASRATLRSKVSNSAVFHLGMRYSESKTRMPMNG